MSDNIVDFDKLKALREAKQDDLPELPKIDLNSEDVKGFLRTLWHLQQVAPNMTGSIDFDEWNARITLDCDMLNMDEDVGARLASMMFQAMIPMAALTVPTEDDTEEPPPSFDDVVLMTHHVLDDLANMVNGVYPDED